MVKKTKTDKMPNTQRAQKVKIQRFVFYAKFCLDIAFSICSFQENQ